MRFIDDPPPLDLHTLINTNCDDFNLNPPLDPPPPPCFIYLYTCC